MNSTKRSGQRIHARWQNQKKITCGAVPPVALRGPAPPASNYSGHRPTNYINFRTRWPTILTFRIRWTTILTHFFWAGWDGVNCVPPDLVVSILFKTIYLKRKGSMMMWPRSPKCPAPWCDCMFLSHQSKNAAIACQCSSYCYMRYTHTRYRSGIPYCKFI